MTPIHFGTRVIWQIVRHHLCILLYSLSLAFSQRDYGCAVLSLREENRVVHALYYTYFQQAGSEFPLFLGLAKGDRV